MPQIPVHPLGLASSVLEEAFQRARAELRASEAAAAAEEAAHPEDDSAPEPAGERLLMGHELLLAVRQPIEWLLALARRLAIDDPDDVAAIDRLTAAFHSRLARGGLGVSVADVLTAFGILLSALDPAVVLAAASKTLTDGVVTIRHCDCATLAAQLGRFVDAVPIAVRRVCAPRVGPGRGTRARRTL